MLELLRRRVCPWQQFVDLAVEMTVDDLCEGVCHPGIRVDTVELAGFDERSDDRPVFSAAVGAREERVLTVERDRADRALNDIESISTRPSSIKVRPFQRDKA